MDVVAMYSGLISHSDTSDEEEKSKTQNDAIADENEQEEDVSEEEEKEVAGEFDEDPDFMASDSPPDEFQSVVQEEQKKSVLPRTMFEQFPGDDE